MLVEHLYSGLISLAVAILAYVIKNLMSENKRLKNADRAKEEALANGVTCLLRVKLMDYHHKYTQAGKVTSQNYQSWFEMYHAYRQLGGNGMVEHMADEMEELKIEG